MNHVKTNKDFDDYLMDCFAKSIAYTEDDKLDDSFLDAFNDWLCDLNVEEWIAYGDKYVLHLEASQCKP